MLDDAKSSMNFVVAAFHDILRIARIDGVS